MSVAAHERWRESLSGGPPYDPDDDLTEMVDRPPARRKEYEAARVLAILDKLAEPSKKEATP